MKRVYYRRFSFMAMWWVRPFLCQSTLQLGRDETADDFLWWLEETVKVVVDDDGLSCTLWSSPLHWSTWLIKLFVPKLSPSAALYIYTWRQLLESLRFRNWKSHAGLRNDISNTLATAGLLLFICAKVQNVSCCAFICKYLTNLYLHFYFYLLLLILSTEKIGVSLYGALP